MPCFKPGLAHIDRAKAKLAEGSRVTALYDSCEGLLHVRHRDGSRLGCFNITWVGMTAEFRPKSSSSFCKLPFVNTSDFLELSGYTFLLIH